MRSRLVLCLFIVLAACHADQRSPSEPALVPAQGAIATWRLSPIDSPPSDFTAVDSAYVVFSTDSQGVAGIDLGVVTALTGPVVVEIEGTLSLDSVPIQLGEVLHAHGTMWWSHAMNLLRAASVAEKAEHQQSAARAPATSFAGLVPAPPPGFEVSLERTGLAFDFLLASDSVAENGEEHIVPHIDSVNSNRVLLTLDSGARGRLRMQWRMNSSGEANISNPTGSCFVVFDRCVQYPPVSRLWTILSFEDTPRAAGEFRVRVFRRQGAIPRLAVSRREVRPVFGRKFDAPSQQIPREPTPGSFDDTTRYDTLRITIPGAPLGADVAARRVVLISRPIGNSGGHRHAAPVGGELERPRGRFFTLGELGHLSRADGGSVERMVILRGVGRDTTVLYRSSGIGGEEWILLRNAGTNVNLDSILINVRVPDLTLFAPDTNFTFQQSSNHGTDDRYLQPDVFRAISAAWAEYRAKPNATHPMSNARFEVSAMSLPFGGLHDIQGRWTWAGFGHQQHKDGVDIDFNDASVEDSMPTSPSSASPRAKMKAICQRQYYRVAPDDSIRLDCQFHTNHFHLSAVPQHRRDALLPWRRIR